MESTAAARRHLDNAALLVGSRNPVHSDVSTQANIRTRPEIGSSYSDDETGSHSRSRMSSVLDSGRRYLSRVTSGPRSIDSSNSQLYSREDIMEQYCVTPHQIRSIAAMQTNHSSSSLFGCFSNNHHSSVCNRTGFLSSCVGRQSNGAEDLAQYWPQKPTLPPPPPPPNSSGLRGNRAAAAARFEWVPEEAEESYHSLERPRPIPIAGFPSKDFGRGRACISEDQVRHAEARMRGHNHTEPNTPLSSRRAVLSMDGEERRVGKHVSFMEARTPLVRSQTTSSFEEAAHAGGFTGPGARWRLAAAKSQERLLDGAIKSKKSPQDELDSAAKAALLEKIKRSSMKTQATQTDIPLPICKPPRTKRHHHHHHQHGYLSLSPRSMHRSPQQQRTRLMKSYSASTPQSMMTTRYDSDTSGYWLPDSEEESVPTKSRSASRESKYKEIFIDFEPNISPDTSPAKKRPLHKTLSEGEILLERRRIQKSDYLERQSEEAATTENAELYGRHFDPTSPDSSPVNVARAFEFNNGTSESVVSSSSLLDEEEFHENLLLREGLFGAKRRSSLNDRMKTRSEGDSSYTDDKNLDIDDYADVVQRPQSQPATRFSPQGDLLIPQEQRKMGGSLCDSLSATNLTSQDSQWCSESQATVISTAMDDSKENLKTGQRRYLISAQQLQKSSNEDVSEETLKPEPVYATVKKPPKKDLISKYSLIPPAPTKGNDISETSEDYITATDNSESSSMRRRKADQVTSAETGSSFESAVSSLHSGRDSDDTPVASDISVSPMRQPMPLPEEEPSLLQHTGETPSSPSAVSSSSSGSYSLQASSVDTDQRDSLKHHDASCDLRRKILVKADIEPHKLDMDIENTGTIRKRTSDNMTDSTPSYDARSGWSEEDKAKAKRGFKLDLPTTPDNSSPSHSGEQITTTPSSQQVKPPRKKVPQRHAPEGELTPGMVRSPAMHQGFRAEDWVVHRASPANTPASSVPKSLPAPTSPHTGGSVSPNSRRLSAQLAAARRGSSSSSSDDDNATSPGRSPNGSRTLPRASPRRRPARSPTATLQRPRRRSASEDIKTFGTNNLPFVTYTASSVRRKSAPRIHSPSRDADGNLLQPGTLHPLHTHSKKPKSNSAKTSPDHVANPTTTTAVKALSAESLRSVSPGSDSVFYDPSCGSGDPSPRSGDTDKLSPSHQPRTIATNGNGNGNGNGMGAFIVEPPAGFADSPEIGLTKSGKTRLYKKQDKRRFKSEERDKIKETGRRHQHRACKHTNTRAKSEERRQNNEENNKMQSSKSAQSSLELLRASGSTPNINMEQNTEDDSGVFCDTFRNGCWLYISSREERLVWRKAMPFTPAGSPPSSPDGSTTSEKDFRRRYQAVTHRMVHRRASADMYTRLASKTFESEQVVSVRRGGGEFGFRIHGSRPVVVSAIEPGTPAETSGLEVGDIVISVNGVSVLDASHSEVVKLAHAGSEVLELEIASTKHVLGEDDLEEESILATVEKCGHLMKRSINSGKWLRRWFVLRADSCLYCYKSPTLECKPLGAVCITQYEINAPEPASLSGDATSEPRWIIRLIRNGNISAILGAATKDEREEWLSALHAAASCPLKWEERLAYGGRLEISPGDIISPDCYGYLHKLGRRWRAWCKMYCILKDACMFLFQSTDAQRASGLLCLHGYRIQSASAGGKRFAFDALAPDPKQRHYYFHTDSELDKKRWMAALEYSIDRWLKIA